MGRIQTLVDIALQLALALIGIGIVVSENERLPLYWSLVAALYVVRRIVRLGATSGDWLGYSPRAIQARFSFALLASMVGLTGGLTIIIRTGDRALDLELRTIAFPMVLLAWAVLHFAFADVYRSETIAAQRANAEPPFVFPGPGPVEPSDFEYFAFTVATTFATSDVEICTAAARRRVMKHSILSFLYNTAILGAAIGLINK